MQAAKVTFFAARRLFFRPTVCALLFATIIGPTTALAAEISGRATVIDGDTIEIRGERIRLQGIDAPESAQLCYQESGKAWRCGQKASLALADMIGERRVECSSRTRDRYGRLIAMCRTDVNLNSFMVRHGWAVAYRRYSEDYIREEQISRKTGEGVWSGRFVMPWDWRRGKRISKANTSDCPVKGNISSKGERIYHVRGGRFYDRTRINPSAGERCFENEAEAKAAGWRKSKQ